MPLLNKTNMIENTKKLDKVKEDPNEDVMSVAELELVRAEMSKTEF